MSELIKKETGKTAGNIKIIRRCFRLEADFPEVGYGNRNVFYHQHDQVTEIAEDLSNIPISSETVPDIVVSFDEACTTVHQVLDPVSNQTVQLSGAAVLAWFIADYTQRAEAILASEN